jgi:hypothetical protein
MTNRVTLPSQDFQKMCKQAEREHESKKLVLLMERVKRQIAERENPSLKQTALKGRATAMTDALSVLRLSSRPAPFDR